jgi:hypothetical protein
MVQILAATMQELRANKKSGEANPFMNAEDAAIDSDQITITNDALNVTSAS